ncbi:MAG: DUF2625 family protein [Myxococcales bacterium]|nr:DUF2625 family protein [Myxococcales bacterium]MDD9967017.1 DUF2625 family protein [Myxococcales bacterium]
MRPLEDLINTEEPGIALVREWLTEASNPVEVLDCEAGAGDETLLALQVTTRSPMGALAHDTGGLLVDHGWVRVLGAGCPRLPRSIAAWNGLGDDAEPRLSGAIAIGDDVVGGFYALNGGNLPGEPGNVSYFAPDSLEWEDLEMSYSQWLHWLFTGDLARFYENTRWPNWESEVAKLGGSQGFTIYPFLWAEGPPVGERTRGAAPIEELWHLHVIEFPRQLRSQT